MKLVATVSNMRELKLAEKADVIELRLDLFNFEKNLLPKREYIITLRRKVDGGAYDGDEVSRIEKLKSFSDLASYVDLECDLPDSVFDEFNCKIIESYHNFKGTPEYNFLSELVENKRGDYFKIATMGKSKDDVVKVVRLLAEHDNVIAFLMGEQFAFTRILTAFLGSPFVYCFVGKAKAPGQIELSKAREILRLMR